VVRFQQWTGAGSGAYSENHNPAFITINGPITQTASFDFPWRLWESRSGDWISDDSVTPRRPAFHITSNTTNLTSFRMDGGPGARPSRRGIIINRRSQAW